ncbi:uncharacterized protein LOC107495188 [Arachis duranensis]|uniref:Uncharacterized protein LOC107495188 n=1 Tax=Arachis duranensis TaxID=130453 RepID=A0A9C6W9V1_ARADU|nr:uncharacterized protein LOC107495188 [Arachis duranensis]
MEVGTISANGEREIGELIAKAMKKVDKECVITISLRNLVWATSKHDVYLISNYLVMHWSSLSGNLSEIINFAGHVAPSKDFGEAKDLASELLTLQ